MSSQTSNLQTKDANEISKGHKLSPVILRAYDIRGEVNVNLNTDDAFAIGMAFGTYIKRRNGQRVCVGYDGRVSSPEIADACIAGMVETGVSVENVGLGPTPMLYFSVKDRMADGGIMITGSHNPPTHNGFKLTLLSGPVFGEAVQELGEISANGDFERGEGSAEEYDITEKYIKRLLKDLDCARPLKVAWDPGNGAAGNVLQELVKHLPGEHFLINEKVDGTFPAHHPDPTVDKNLEQLRQVVLDRGCDIGIAYDGDADRIGVIDNNGDVIRGDTLLTIYARQILKENPGASIIGDIKCSQTFLDEIKRLGGKPVLWKTGHSLIKNKLSELAAPLAGELSGHIFFADKYYGFDDALYCSIRLMNAVSQTEKGITEFLTHLPRLHNTPEIRIEVDEERKFQIIENMPEHLQNLDIEGKEVLTIDGIRLNMPQGWLLIRASNTQNAISLRMEATSEDSLNDLKKLARESLQKNDIDTSEIE